MNKKAILHKIKVRERQHYPDEMRQIQFCESWRDFVEYCEGAPTVKLLGDEGYLIHTKDEIVDLACSAPRLVVAAVLYLRRKFAGKKLTADFRATTSWPLFMRMEKYVIIHAHEEWYWNSELMHHVEFTVKNISPRKGL